MSYATLVKSLPDRLQQPSGIALLASIGVHGLMAIFMPLFTYSSRVSDSDFQQPVELVELSPEEQARLPQFNPAPEAVPAPPENGWLASLPQAQSGDMLPVPSADGSMYAIPFGPPPALPDQAYTPIPLPPPGELAPPPNLTPPPNLPTLPVPAEGNQPQTSFQQVPDLQSLTSPSTPPPSPDSPSPSPTPYPGVRPSRIPQAAIAYQQERRRQLQAQAQAQSPGANNPIEPGDRTQQQLAESTQVASSVNAEVTQQAGEGALKGDWKTQATIRDFYPEPACAQKLSGQTALMLVINPAGKLAVPPKIFVSSESRTLDNAALSYADSMQFAPSDQMRYWILPFQFTYAREICPATAVPQSPTPNPQPPAPRTQPTAPSVTVPTVRSPASPPVAPPQPQTPEAHSEPRPEPAPASPEVSPPATSQ